MPPHQERWDDDDDVPLSSFAKPAPSASSAAPLQPAKGEGSSADRKKAPPGKGGKEKTDSSKGRKQEASIGWGDIDRVLREQDAQKGGRTRSKTFTWVSQNYRTVLTVACVLAFFYFRIAQEFYTGGGIGNQQEQEDPFKVLGVSQGSSDAEIKRAYYKLSLKLHPDKNPDASQEDSDRFARITQAYSVLSDPVKKKRWLNNENPDHTSIPSDTESLTDKQMDAQLKPKSAWLVLAYADWSSESWEIADKWEQSAKDLGRYVQVGRINIDKEKGLAKKFNVMSVPMIYTYIDGTIQTFYGEPTHANLTLFLTRNLGDVGLSLLRDSNGGSFLTERPEQIKAILFAPSGAIKLRLAFRSFARKFRTSMDFAEATVRGSEKLRYLYGVTKEPAIVIVKEAGTKPYIYSGQMTHGRLMSLFAQHQFDPVVRLTVHNYKPLCGIGMRGEAPCIVYLHNSSKDSEHLLVEVQAAMRNASLEDQAVAVREEPERMSMAFTWIDLARHHKLHKLLASVSAKVIALDARSKLVMPFEGDFKDPKALLEWARHLASGTDSSDWDPLGGPIELAYEALPWYWRAELRKMTQHLMSLIALVAVLLLWYALQNLYFDYKESRKREGVKRNIDRTLQKQKQSESVKLTKWQQIEAQNKAVADAKRKEQEEKERRRQEAAREADLEREREAKRAREEAAKKAAAQAAANKAAAAAAARAAAQKPSPAPAAQQKPEKKTVRAVSDSELCDAIERLVASGDLTTLTKRALREQLQAMYPQVDLLQRKDVVAKQIEVSVQRRVDSAQ